MADRLVEADDARRRFSGLRWGPFTLRVPLIHSSVAWPELLQGLLVAGATGLAIVPILQEHFDLSFEQSVAFVMLQSMLICSAPIIFGEPFAPGWITPALPLALVLLLAAGPDGEPLYATSQERFQFMTAVTLDFTVLLLALGITGLGQRFIAWLPRAIKGGMILGASIAAFKRVFLDDFDRFFGRQPISTSVALALCLLLTFSAPLQPLKKKYWWLARIAAMGLLPGFVAAALIGPLFGEVSYQWQWGVLYPPFAEMFAKTSPFSIGWPTLAMLLHGAPLAVTAYVILFGDIITGTEILKAAQPFRQDEIIDLNINRSHYALAIRNALMSLAVPLFPTQGSLWAGVHVLIVQRWSEGRRSMDSLFSGISSYYMFGLPVLFMLLPIVSILRPLMGIALSMTLVLTGFACAYVAMGFPRTNAERGVVALMAMSLAFFTNPWVGLLVGIAATWAVAGWTDHQVAAAD